MAAAKDRVMYAADSARPYVERALRDQEFRDNLRAAFTAARAIFEELSSQRGLTSVASRVATDEEIHSNLRRAISELRQAADRLQARERDQRSHTLRNLSLVLFGVAIGVFFNPLTGPGSRRWIKNKVTGRGEEFHSNSNSSPNGGYGADE